MKSTSLTRTAYESLLYKHRISLRDVGHSIGCSYEYARLLAAGKRPLTGKIGAKFIALIEALKSPSRQPSPVAASCPVNPPLTGQGNLSQGGAI